MPLDTLDELEETAAKRELQTMMKLPGNYKLLEAAVVVLKVLAVGYFLIAFYSLCLAPAEPTSSRSLSEKIGPLATLMTMSKEALIAFLVFVSGELIRLQLDIRRLVGGA
jgi:hypothetical protein